MSTPACAFTICSRNYLHYATTLMQSVRRHSPDVARFIVLCDVPGGYPPVPDDLATVIPMADLPIQNIHDLVSKYTVIELNTAIKPAAFLLLMERQFEKVIYFDPDIRLYAPMTDLLDRLNQAEMLLTPHICEPVTDTAYPGEQVFLQTGIYNLGFVAVNTSESIRAFMRWWDTRLSEHCVIDLQNGYFVDQKWMDYAPAFIPSLEVVRDPGWNMAYWNLMHRELNTQSDGYRVNGRPLFFFHFSGLPISGNRFSKHQDRFNLSDLTETGRKLVEEYRRDCKQNGMEPYSSIPYGYGFFPGGRPIHSFFYHVYRNEPETARRLGPLHQGGNEEAWRAFALGKPGGHPLLNRAALHVYSTRPDLQHAFPEVESGQDLAYAVWFVENAESQESIDPIFVEDVRKDLPRHLSSGGFIQLAKTLIFRTLYKVAFKLYPLVERFTSVEFRGKVHLFIKNRAYNSRHLPRQHSVQPRGTPGVNLIGYLNAESGVGQAGRLSLEALHHQSEFPVAVVPISTGCVSRTDADTPGATETLSTPYALNLFQVNADMTYPVIAELPESSLKGKQNIGYWYWEMPEFPEIWQSAFDPFREIWVASTFCQKSIAARSPVPVVVLPPAVTVNPNPAFDRAHFNLPEDEFLFLCMGDALSFLERKNPMGAYKAFKTAFPENDQEVKLVLKLLNPRQCSPEVSKWVQEVRNDPQVILMDQYMNQAEVHSLILTCNALVSLHRSEGFGLPIAEAMLLQRPVIATGWSSNMDFMNMQNSLPVQFDLIELDRDYGPYQKGMHWAEPDLAHGASQMRWCVDHPDEAAALALRGQVDIQTHYHPDVAGARMRDRLNFLFGHEGS